MRLPNDYSRCLGLSVVGSKIGTIVCERRATCARYVQRNTGGERTPTMAMICHHEVDAYIREEKDNDNGLHP
jgi:hypothetical protein